VTGRNRRKACLTGKTFSTICAIKATNQAVNDKGLPKKAFFSTLYSGSPTWTRTRDLRINSPSLYQLSYQGIEAALYLLVSISQIFQKKI
jgi:hypothetical protein